MSTAVQKGALLTLHTASRDGKRKKVKPSTAEESNIDWLNSGLYSNLTKQREFSHKHNLSLNNLPDKTTVVQYSICNLNWQNLTFHNLILMKQTDKTSFSKSEFHKIDWQNFIRTSHFLKVNLSGINSDKAKFTIWFDRGWLRKASFSWSLILLMSWPWPTRPKGGLSLEKDWISVQMGLYLYP